MVLSIIVPSYNAEKYVPQFEKNFYSSNLEGKVEFLLIDDGATDNTLELLEELSKKHPQYFRTFHKSNGGHGSVINFGVEKANGHFFKVIDGDDSIDIKELENFVSFLEKNADKDLIVSDFIRFYLPKNDAEYVKSYYLDKSEKKSANLLHGFPFLQLHSVTFSLKIWKENNIKVRENCFYEDQEYCIYPLPFVDSFVYYPHPTYIYRIGVEGQSISQEGRKKHSNDHSACMRDLLSYYSAHEESFPYKGLFDEYIAFAARNHYENLMMINYPNSPRSDIKMFDEEMRRFPILRKKARKWKIVRGLTAFHCSFSRLFSRFYFFVKR